MKMSRWVIAVLVAFAIFFAATAVRSYFGEMWIGPTPMLAASGYSLLLAAMVSRSAGVDRAVMMVAAAAIMLAYIGRLAYLVGNPFLYRYSPIAPLSSETVTDALLFMAAGTVALWAGLKLTLPLRAPTKLHETTVYAVALRYWAVVAAVGYLNIGLRIVLRATGVVGAQDGSGFVFKLVLNPTGGLGILVMVTLLILWDRLKLGEKFLLGGVIIAGMLDTLSIGAMGALLQPFLLWFVTVPFVRGDVRIPFRLVAGIAVFAVVVVPLYMQTANVIELSGASGVPGDHQVSIADIPAAFGQFERPVRVLSGRMSGLDALVAVMNYEPEGKDDFVRLDLFARGMAGRFVPEVVYDPGVPSAGKLFAVFYQRLPWDFVHVGGWYAFGFLFGYMGWFGTLGAAMLGAAVGATYRALPSRTFIGLILWILVVNRVIWGGIVSGNFDSLISGAIIDGALVVLWIGGAMILAQNQVAAIEQRSK